MGRIIRDWGRIALLACLGISALVGGCSSGADEPASEAENTGSVGLELQLGSGLTLAEVNYTVVGAAGFTKSGALSLSKSTTLSGLIAGLPVGSYTITLSGVTGDGTTSCAGSASFDVAAHETSIATVHLLCHQAPTTGSVAVGGTLNICPALDGVSSTALEALVGGTIDLSSQAHDADHGPAALAYAWSSSSGTISDATLPATTFSCTTPGPATITLTVSDGDPGADCAAQASITVTCTPTASDVQAILDANCVSCHSGARPPRGLSLVDVTTVIGSPASGCAQKTRIVPGAAQHSYLVDKILGSAQDGGCFSGRQMPLNKPALSEHDISLITSWINAGSP